MSSNPPTSRPGALRRMGWRGVVSILLAVVAVILIAQNFQTVQVTFLTVTFSVWLWLLLVVVFVAGMVLDGLVRRVFRALRSTEADRG